LGEREREAATYSGAIKIKVWIGLHSFIFLLIYYQELELLPHWTGKIYNTRKKKKKKKPFNKQSMREFYFIFDRKYERKFNMLSNP